MVSYLLAAVGRRAVRDEAVVEVFIDHHDRRLIATPIAVVGRREDRNTLVGVGPLVALHHQLMRTHDKIESVAVVELLRDVGSEGVARAWYQGCVQGSMYVRMGA